MAIISGMAKLSFVLDLVEKEPYCPFAAGRRRGAGSHIRRQSIRMSQRIFPITMPKWGIEMTQGTITAWHAQPGQAVTKGDALLDVETEKIVNSVESPASGTLRRILADSGATENVGALIAVFAEADVAEADVDAFIAGFQPADTGFEPEDSSAPAPSAATAAAPPPASAAAPAVSADGWRRQGQPDRAPPRGAPRDRRVGHQGHRHPRARLEGGRRSVRRVAAGWSRAVPLPRRRRRQSQAQVPVRERMTSMRATIAKRLLESKQTIPHYRLAVDVELTALLAHRATLNTGGATKVSINDLLVRATALALARHPEVNAQLQGDEIVKYAQADVCVAVASANGLVTPVVRAAETKTAAQIAAEVADLAERARGNRLTREEITRRHIHGVQPGDVRRRSLRRHHQPATGGDPGRRRCN